MESLRFRALGGSGALAMTCIELTSCIPTLKDPEFLTTIRAICERPEYGAFVVERRTDSADIEEHWTRVGVGLFCVYHDNWVNRPKLAVEAACFEAESADAQQVAWSGLPARCCAGTWLRWPVPEARNHRAERAAGRVAALGRLGPLRCSIRATLHHAGQQRRHLVRLHGHDPAPGDLRGLRAHTGSCRNPSFGFARTGSLDHDVAPWRRPSETSALRGLSGFARIDRTRALARFRCAGSGCVQ